MQIVFVSLMIGIFFVGFGLLTVTPELTATWVGSEAHPLVDGTLRGRPMAVTTELLQVAVL
ncbi:MAG TPA: hypothetical protein VM388_12355 [Acidimicrobiales bacterium]|nr:hypothetical protein [Acidimicrobiales bacterium]